MAIPILDILNIGTKLISSIFPDPAQQEDAKLKLLTLYQTGELAALSAQANIIQAEANSESWLAKSWRPLTMLTFAGLIVARWFGFAAPNLSAEEYIKLWDIVQLGLGGYVIGRSTEKVASTISEAIQNFKVK